MATTNYNLQLKISGESGQLVSAFDKADDSADSFNKKISETTRLVESATDATHDFSLENEESSKQVYTLKESVASMIPTVTAVVSAFAGFLLVDKFLELESVQSQIQDLNGVMDDFKLSVDNLFNTSIEATMDSFTSGFESFTDVVVYATERINDFSFLIKSDLGLAHLREETQLWFDLFSSGSQEAQSNLSIFLGFYSDNFFSVIKESGDYLGFYFAQLQSTIIDGLAFLPLNLKALIQVMVGQVIVFGQSLVANLQLAWIDIKSGFANLGNFIDNIWGQIKIGFASAMDGIIQNLGLSINKIAQSLIGVIGFESVVEGLQDSAIALIRYGQSANKARANLSLLNETHRLQIADYEKEKTAIKSLQEVQDKAIKDRITTNLIQFETAKKSIAQQRLNLAAQIKTQKQTKSNTDTVESYVEEQEKSNKTDKTAITVKKALVNVQKNRLKSLQNEVGSLIQLLNKIKIRNDLFEQGITSQKAYTTALIESQIASAILSGATQAEIDLLNQKLTLSQQISDEVLRGDTIKARLDAEKKAALEIKKYWQDVGKSIQNSLTDALFNSFESGQSFGENLKDNLINTFKTMVLRPSIEAVVGGVFGGFSGTGQNPASSGLDFNQLSNAITSSSQNQQLGVTDLITSGISAFKDTALGYAGDLYSGVSNFFAGSAGGLSLSTVSSAVSTASDALSLGSSVNAAGEIISGSQTAIAASAGSMEAAVNSYTAATQTATTSAQATSGAFSGVATAGIGLIAGWAGNKYGGTNGGALAAGGAAIGGYVAAGTAIGGPWGAVIGGALGIIASLLGDSLFGGGDAESNLTLHTFTKDDPYFQLAPTNNNNEKGAFQETALGGLAAQFQHVGKDGQLSDEDAAKYTEQIKQIFDVVAQLDQQIANGLQGDDLQAAKNASFFLEKGGNTDIQAGLTARYSNIVATLDAELQSVYNEFISLGDDGLSAVSAMIVFRDSIGQSREIYQNLLADLNVVAGLKNPDETLSVAFSRLGIQLDATNIVLNKLGLETIGVSTSAVKLADDLITVSGGLNELGLKTNNFYELYYSETEKTADVYANALTAVEEFNKKWGVNLDIKDRDSIRVALEGQRNNGSVEGFNAILDFASPFDQFTQDYALAMQPIAQGVAAWASLTNAYSDYEELVKDGSLNIAEQYFKQRDSLLELAYQYDGTEASTQRLTAGLVQQRDATIQLLALIDQISDSISETYNSSIEDIRQSILPADQLYQYLTDKAEGLEKTLDSLISPEEIKQTADEINKLTIQAYNGLSPEQQKEVADKYIQFLTNVEAKAQEKLTGAKTFLGGDSEKNLPDEIAEAVANAIKLQSKASEQAAKDMISVASKFDTAINSFSGAIKGIPQNINVTFAYPPPQELYP